MRPEINKFFKTYFDDYIEKYPLSATFIGIHKYNHLYPNYLSDSEIKKDLEFNSKYLSEATNLQKNFQNLNSQETHFINLLKSRLNDNIEGHKHPFHLLPLDQFNNFIIDYIDLASGKSYLP